MKRPAENDPRQGETHERSLHEAFISVNFHYGLHCCPSRHEAGIQQNTAFHAGTVMYNLAVKHAIHLIRRSTCGLTRSKAIERRTRRRVVASTTQLPGIAVDHVDKELPMLDGNQAVSDLDLCYLKRLNPS